MNTVAACGTSGGLPICTFDGNSDGAANSIALGAEVEFASQFPGDRLAKKARTETGSRHRLQGRSAQLAPLVSRSMPRQKRKPRQPEPAGQMQYNLEI